MVSETKVTETGMGNRVRAAALRIMEARRSRMVPLPRGPEAAGWAQASVRRPLGDGDLWGMFAEFQC